MGTTSQEQEMLSKMQESGITQGKGPRKSNLPFDPEGAEYDYRTAKSYGITPDETGHWPSRAPNGQLLKGTAHPTFYKTVEGEREAGYEVTQGEDGKYYSHPAMYKEAVPYAPVPPSTLCPDGTIVGGTKCFEMPDGTYEGDNSGYYPHPSMHREARDKTTQWLLNYKLEREAKPTTSLQWAREQYLPSSRKPMDAGLKQGIAALATIPNFLIEDLPKLPFTLAHNIAVSKRPGEPEYEGAVEAQLPYTPSSDAAYEYYTDPNINLVPFIDLGISEEDVNYPQTPGNVGANLATSLGAVAAAPGGWSKIPAVSQKVGKAKVFGQGFVRGLKDGATIARRVKRGDPETILKLNTRGPHLEFPTTPYNLSYGAYRGRDVRLKDRLDFRQPVIKASDTGAGLETQPWLFDPLEAKLYAASSANRKMTPGQIKKYLNQRQGKTGSLGEHMGKVSPAVWDSNPELGKILEDLPKNKAIDPLTLLSEKWTLANGEQVQYQANHILRHDLPASGRSETDLLEIYRKDLQQSDEGFSQNFLQLGVGEKDVQLGLREPLGTADKMVGRDMLAPQQYTGATSAYKDPWGRSTSMTSEHPEYLSRGLREGHYTAPLGIEDIKQNLDHPWAVSFSRGARFWEAKGEGKLFSLPGKKDPKSDRPWQVIQEIQSDQIQEFEKGLYKSKRALKNRLDEYIDELEKQPDLITGDELKELKRIRTLEVNQLRNSDWDFITGKTFKDIRQGVDKKSALRAEEQVRYQKNMQRQLELLLMKQQGLAELKTLAQETGIDILSAELGNTFHKAKTPPWEIVERPSLSGTSLETFEDPYRALASTAEEAWTELGVERGRVSRAINRKIPQSTLDENPSLTRQDIRKRLIARAHDLQGLEFKPYRDVGNSHPIVKMQRKKIEEEFKNTHDMRKYKTASKDAYEGFWYNHRDRYDKIYEIEDQVDAFIARNWDQIYKDGENAQKAVQIARTAQAKAKEIYPPIDRLAMSDYAFETMKQMQDPQLNPRLSMGHTFYRDHLARAMQNAMIEGDVGVAWPLGIDKELRSGYGGAKMVYGSEKDPGRLGKEAQKLMGDMGQPKSSVRTVDIYTNPTKTPLIDEKAGGPQDKPYPEVSKMRGVEFTPEMIEHAKKYGIPLSSVGAAMPLAEQDESNSSTISQDVFNILTK